MAAHRRSAFALRLAVGGLALLSGASLAATVWQARVTGLRLTIEPPGDSPVEVLAQQVTSDELLLNPAIPSGIRAARWRGQWLVARDGRGTFLLRGRGAARVWVDDVLVLQAEGGMYREERALGLERGPHAVRAEFETRGPLPVFKLFMTAAGQTAPAEGGRDLFPGIPSATTERLLAMARLARGAAMGAWTLAFLWATLRFRKRRAFLPTLATLVVLYAGALRLEAVVREYWGMDAPGWARRVAAAVGPLRPGALKLSPVDHPYPGDPGAYLRFAREMRHFYGAHVREPLFVLAAKTGLSATGGADVAISLTSAVFSTLLVWGTYLLGSAAFGGRVGLMAALLMGIEPLAISLGADGWRDDAFSFFVVLSAWSLTRLQARPSPRTAVVSGLAGAAACLTRITSLSFLLTASAFLGVDGDRAARRGRLRAAGVSLLITLLLLAPYLVTCALVFGDPFVSINAHTQFYRARASLPWDPSMTWPQYLATTFRPLELLQNLAIGLTAYPFTNKWAPYDVWLPHLSIALQALSLVGLVLFLKSREGRLVLVVLLSALVPFAFTWRIPGGSEWRFTLHAYPFYLLAASLAFEAGRGALWGVACRAVGSRPSSAAIDTATSGDNVLRATQT